MKDAKAFFEYCEQNENEFKRIFALDEEARKAELKKLGFEFADSELLDVFAEKGVITDEALASMTSGGFRDDGHVNWWKMDEINGANWANSWGQGETRGNDWTTE